MKLGHKAKRLIQIYVSVMSLGVLLLAYNQCVPQFNKAKRSGLQFESTAEAQQNSTTSNDSSGPGSGSNSGSSGDNGGGIVQQDVRAVSITAFGESVHQITNLRCFNCHGQFQQPLHAVDDVTQAHDAVINAAKVNFTNTSQSRLVLKLESGHQCWKDCNEAASDMLVAINYWKDAVDAANLANEQAGSSSGSASGGGNQGGNSDNVVTDETLPLGQELENNEAANPGTIVLGVEGAMLKNPMVSATEGETTYIWVPEGDQEINLPNNNDDAGWGHINFDSPSTDVYKIYGLVDAPNNSDNSFHVRVLGGNYVEWHIPTTEGFEWREVTNTGQMVQTFFPIPQGGNQLEIRQREDGTKIAMVVITDDLNIDLSTVQANKKITLSFDLAPHTGVIGSRFEIDFEEYDAYTYKFSSPRIITGGASIRVVDIRPLVNGNYNPQHSTYTLVDMVAQGTTELSPYSLLVLVDQGLSVDRVSFSFGTLEVQ